MNKYTNEQLIEELQDRGYLNVLWHKGDIRDSINDRMDIKDCTDADVDDIAEYIENNHDCSIGLSWDIIEYFITDYFASKIDKPDPLELSKQKREDEL